MTINAALPLQSLKGEVLRLRGVIDRFGGFQQQGRVLYTVCVRNLEHAATGQPIEPDHWWFRLRQPWMESGIQPGDTILLTAKVRICSKGHHDPELAERPHVRSREQVVGLAGDIRDLVILSRAIDDRQHLHALQDELRRERLLRQEAEADLNRLTSHRDALLNEMDRLRGQITLWRHRCRRPEVAPRAASHGRTGRGFASLLPATAGAASAQSSFALEAG